MHINTLNEPSFRITVIQSSLNPQVLQSTVSTGAHHAYQATNEPSIRITVIQESRGPCLYFRPRANLISSKLDQVKQFADGAASEAGLSSLLGVRLSGVFPKSKLECEDRYATVAGIWAGLGGLS